MAEAEQYYPCITNWDTNQISKPVGPAMSHAEAIQYLKKHYSGAWEKALAAPQLVSHEFFKKDQPK